MNLTRCENGHFYDADKFASCPHCQSGAMESSPTVGMRGETEGQAVTMPGSAVGVDMVIPNPSVKPSLVNTIREITTRPTIGDDDDDSKTVYINEAMGGKAGTEPVVGWLVCVKGDYYGESFSLKTGRNFIGRSSSMDIVLAKDNSVSRDRHAIVLFEPRKREFLTQPGDSRSLFYLNDDVVLMTEKLKKGDILTLGNTKLMFVPCCGPDFGWDTCEDSGRGAY